MRHCSFAVALVAACAAGCARTEEAPPNEPAELQAARTEIQQRMNAYGEELRRGDIPAILGFWMPDARVQEVGSETTGTELTHLAREFFPANEVAAFAATSSEIAAHDAGTVVYQWGNYTESIQPRDSTASPTMTHANYVARWVKDENGNWRIHRFLAVPMPRKAIAVPVAFKSADEPVGSLDHRIATDQVISRLNGYAAALRSNAPDRILNFWTQDAQLIAPQQHLIGKTSLEAFIRETLSTNRIKQIELTSREIFVHDDGTIAYQYGDCTETLEPADGSTPPSTAHNGFLARWRRGADGLWRLDSFVTVPKPPGPSRGRN